MTARTVSRPKPAPKPKTDLPATARLFQKSTAGWYSQWKARKGVAGAATTTTQPG